MENFVDGEWCVAQQKIGKSNGWDIILLRLNEKWARYCIQYAGAGMYRQTEEETWEIIHRRWPWIKREKIKVFKGDFPRKGEQHD